MEPSPAPVEGAAGDSRQGGVSPQGSNGIMATAVHAYVVATVSYVIASFVIGFAVVGWGFMKKWSGASGADLETHFEIGRWIVLGISSWGAGYGVGLAFRSIVKCFRGSLLVAVVAVASVCSGFYVLRVAAGWAFPDLPVDWFPLPFIAIFALLTAEINAVFHPASKDNAKSAVNS